MHLNEYTTICGFFSALEERELSEGEGQAAFDGARRLRKVKYAAIAGHKGPIALRKQVSHINQRLHAIG